MQLAGQNLKLYADEPNIYLSALYDDDDDDEEIDKSDENSGWNKQHIICINFIDLGDILFFNKNSTKLKKLIYQINVTEKNVAVELEGQEERSRRRRGEDQWWWPVWAAAELVRVCYELEIYSSSRMNERGKKAVEY
uniref:Uncharacterized protein n=1 Tax=Syphacia muris TaxID=451379 RepID=A0A0N5AI06_9BILA